MRVCVHDASIGPTGQPQSSSKLAQDQLRDRLCNRLRFLAPRGRYYYYPFLDPFPPSHPIGSIALLHPSTAPVYGTTGVVYHAGDYQS